MCYFLPNLISVCSQEYIEINTDTYKEEKNEKAFLKSDNGSGNGIVSGRLSRRRAGSNEEQRQDQQQGNQQRELRPKQRSRKRLSLLRLVFLPVQHLRVMRRLLRPTR